jgi:hypothetical protein
MPAKTAQSAMAIGKPIAAAAAGVAAVAVAGMRIKLQRRWTARPLRRVTLLRL